MRLHIPVFLSTFLLIACDGALQDDSGAGDSSAANANSGAGVSQAASADTGESSPGALIAQEDDEISLTELESQLGVSFLNEPWSGDLDGMVQRRIIRVLTVYGAPRYFLDGPEQKGIVYEYFTAYEKQLNEQEKTGNLKVHVIFIPVARDQLLSGLQDGRGDIAAASLTITPEREELVDFSDPASKQISEVLVTGPTAPPVKTLDDLAGQTIHVRASSSYFESLQALNKKLIDAGKPAIDIQPISELLEDEDILEMVHAGLLPWTVVDDYQAAIWVNVFDGLTVRPDLVVRSGGYLGYAFRKNSPQLKASLDAFVKANRQGTLFGNILINRYIKDFDFVNNSLEQDEYAKFRRIGGVFRQYGDQYGVDYLMAAAQGYQESRLDQSVRSPAGAIGVMQLLPSTAKDPNVGIPDIHVEEKNIQAGIKYLSFIRNRYFNDPEMDTMNQTLMALASYNAGPAKVNSLREQAARQGLNPDLWFNNVEVIAAKEIGRETVQYVANIFKYYSAYLMATERELQREAEKKREGLD